MLDILIVWLEVLAHYFCYVTLLNKETDAAALIWLTGVECEKEIT